MAAPSLASSKHLIIIVHRIIIMDFKSPRMTKNLFLYEPVCLFQMVLISTKCPGDAEWPEWSLHLGGDFLVGPGELTILQMPHLVTHLACACSWADQLAEALCKHVPGLSHSAGFPSEHSSSTFIMSIYARQGLGIRKEQQ